MQDTIPGYFSLGLVILTGVATIALGVGCALTLRPGERTFLRSQVFWGLVIASFVICPGISAVLLGVVLAARLVGQREEQHESERQLQHWEREGRREAKKRELEQKAREMEKVERDRTVILKQQAQGRRRDARAACELLYLKMAPEIGARFTRAMLNEWIGKYLTDEHSPDEVERRAEQLKSLIVQHFEQAVREPERRRREEEEARRRKETEEKENQELLRKLIEQRAADEREAEKAARRNRSLASRIQEILAMNYPEAVRERKIAELLDGVNLPDRDAGRATPVTGDDE